LPVEQLPSEIIARDTNHRKLFKFEFGGTVLIPNAPAFWAIYRCPKQQSRFWFDHIILDRKNFHATLCTSLTSCDWIARKCDSTGNEDR